MKGLLFIDNDLIGEADFKIIDESMGAIGGDLVPDSSYNKYKPFIQEQCSHKGVSNTSDFNFRMLLEDTTELNPEGGIGVTDLAESEEIYLEIAGLERHIFQRFI